MAKYRQIHTSFWQDGFVTEDLSPEERYFYLYLMTNSKTSQCGIYELPIKTMVNETGLDRGKIIDLISCFTKHNKIQYCEETKEIMMMNWLKYNPINNENLQKCVIEELKDVKNEAFLQSYLKSLEPYSEADEKGLIRGLQGATKTLPSKGVKNKEQRIKNKEQRVKSKEEGEEPSPVQKKTVAENVSVTDEEYQQLVEEHGQIETDQMIVALNIYKGSTGKKYKSDFYTIQNWFRRDAKDKAHPGKSQDKNKSAATMIIEMNERGEFD